ncbi:unnamed protein product [Prunus armeniaca]|uniref:Uncharacterized protein n=1 Tax=Prunus armeniaca TaxID=36596 RepID=A0A6J5UCD9_PRUAR|nr:unnamed protein product [Prunus armeniaca]
MIVQRTLRPPYGGIGMHPMLGLNDGLFVVMTMSTRIIGMRWWSIGMGLKVKNGQQRIELGGN